MAVNWDARFLSLAEHVGQWSKDPSTKTGAVIVDPYRRVVSLGYNGFARGIADTAERLDNRELKYRLVVHCERNAMLFASRPLEGCTLYTWPFGSCAPCAAMVIQVGVARVVFPELPPELRERWGPDLDLALTMFSEARVQVTETPSQAGG